MTRALALALASAMVGLLVSPVRADPCEDPTTDPVALPLRDTGFDRGRAACLRSDLSSAVSGVATIDTPRFYGTIAGALRVAGRFTRGDRVEWGFGARAVDYTFAQDAVIQATGFRFGPIDAHVAYGGSLHVTSPRDRWAVVGTIVVPFTSSTLMDTVDLAAQLAAVGTVQASPRWTAHVRVAGLAMGSSSAAGDHASAALVVGADAIARITARFRVGLGADLQAGWRGAFDHLLVRAATQRRIGDAYRIELGVGLPVGGQERIDLGVAVGVVRDL
jgi:hypothetical protein